MAYWNKFILIVLNIWKRTRLPNYNHKLIILIVLEKNVTLCFFNFFYCGWYLHVCLFLGMGQLSPIHCPLGHQVLITFLLFPIFYTLFFFSPTSSTLKLSKNLRIITLSCSNFLSTYLYLPYNPESRQNKQSGTGNKWKNLSLVFLFVWSYLKSNYLFFWWVSNLSKLKR